MWAKLLHSSATKAAAWASPKRLTGMPIFTLQSYQWCHTNARHGTQGTDEHGNHLITNMCFTHDSLFMVPVSCRHLRTYRERAAQKINIENIKIQSIK
jgi:hypothetical protein